MIYRSKCFTRRNNTFWIFQKNKMKTLLVVCVLAITTAVYSIDESELKRYHANADACSKTLGVPRGHPTDDMLLCVAEKDGMVLDKEGKIHPDKVHKRLEQLISDPDKLEEGKKIVANCFKDVYQGAGNIKEQTLKGMKCSLPTLNLIDKLQ